MSTPVTTSHRNLRHRIDRLLSTAKDPTPWQLERVGDALDDLEFGRYPEGERVMSMAERPDLYEPKGFAAGAGVTVDALRRRLGEIAVPRE